MGMGTGPSCVLFYISYYIAILFYCCGISRIEFYLFFKLSYFEFLTVCVVQILHHSISQVLCPRNEGG